MLINISAIKKYNPIEVMLEMNKKRKLKLFIVLGILSLLVINLTIISGYILINSYGKMYLNPGEEYTVNIPFKLFQSPVVSGKAQQLDGTPISGVKVIVNDSDNSILGEDTTNSNGEYSITLPKISERKQFSVFIEYDNETSGGDSIALGEHEYSYKFDNYLNYSRSTDDSVTLTGTIENEEAKIEDGRIEISLRKCTGETTSCNEVLDTETYHVNIDPLNIYQIPSNEIDYSWQINSGTETGKYKIEITMSFNGKETTPTSMVYFHITP
jgi:hypothetical protein